MRIKLTATEKTMRARASAKAYYWSDGAKAKRDARREYERLYVDHAKEVLDLLS